MDQAGTAGAEPERAAASLGIFAGHPADWERCGTDFAAELPSPRAARRPGWTAARSPAGHPVLLAGWIDNRTELEAELGTGPCDPARLYAAAVERWGIDADRRVIGNYAALARALSALRGTLTMVIIGYRGTLREIASRVVRLEQGKIVGDRQMSAG